MKKKIVFINKALWYGGIETSLLTLLDRINYEEYDVTLILFRAVFDFDLKERVNKNCKLIVLDREKAVSFNQKYRYSRLYHFVEPCKNPSLIHKLMMWSVPVVKWIENELYIRYAKGLLKNEIFDTAIIYSDVVGEIAVRAIRAKKYLMYYHHGAMRHVYHDFIPWKKCEKIIAVSNNQAELLRGYFSDYADKITVIHNLIDITGIRKKSIMEIPEYFDQTKFNIVSVGRVSYEKGMDIAVRVCAKLVADGFDNVCWWIIGAGSAMQEVYNTIIEHHMEDYVLILGRKSNPYPYISNADLYVQPSRFEAYGLTIMEALVLGRVVVSTNTSGAQEILQDGSTGLVCSVKIEELAKNVEYMINNPRQLDIMKKNVATLDFEKQNQECISLLKQLL